jgi:hypothetical protein
LFLCFFSGVVFEDFFAKKNKDLARKNADQLPGC